MTDYNKIRQFDQREIARMFGVPDRYIGIPCPWWRHLWQRYVTRR